MEYVFPGIRLIVRTGWDASKRIGGIVLDATVPNPAAPTPTIDTDEATTGQVVQYNYDDVAVTMPP